MIPICGHHRQQLRPSTAETGGGRASTRDLMNDCSEWSVALTMRTNNLALIELVAQRRAYRRASAPGPSGSDGPVKEGGANVKNKYARKRASFMRKTHGGLGDAGDAEAALAAVATSIGAEDGKNFGGRRSSTSTAAASAATASTKPDAKSSKRAKSRRSV